MTGLSLMGVLKCDRIYISIFFTILDENIQTFSQNYDMSLLFARKSVCALSATF